MRHPVLTQRRVFCLVALPLVLVASFLPERWVQIITSRPRALAQAIYTPVTQPLLRLTGSLRRPEDLPLATPGAQGMEKRYNEMYQYAKNLEERLRKAEEQVARLSQIRTSIGLRNAQLLQASVSSPPTAGPAPTITIDQGESQGVRKGQVVAVSDGLSLAGYVLDTGPVTATVGLISRPGTRLDVRIAPQTTGPAPREVVAQLVANDQGRFETTLGKDRPVEQGDLAHLSDERWPATAQGFVIGQVVAVERDPQDPLAYRKIVVQPVRSLAHLREVLVLIPASNDTPLPTDKPRSNTSNNTNNNAKKSEAR
jgi:cell shape-determining protein MreC